MEGHNYRINKKSLILVITTVTYDAKEEFGTLKGYSTVNGKNNTSFQGTYSNQGTLNLTLEEPGVNTTDGKFVIATQGIPNSYSTKVKTLIGKWISYDTALEKEVLVAKIEKR